MRRRQEYRTTSRWKIFDVALCLAVIFITIVISFAS